MLIASRQFAVLACKQIHWTERLEGIITDNPLKCGQEQGQGIWDKDRGLGTKSEGVQAGRVGRVGQAFQAVQGWCKQPFGYRRSHWLH